MLENKNILVLISDQHRHDCLGCSGHSLVKTPHLDRLAAQGTRFTQAVSNPPCVPSRHSFISGYFPHQTGVMTNAHCWSDPTPFPTIGNLLKDAGYHTASIGKMHWNQTPSKRGFDLRVADDFFGDIEGPLDDAYCQHASEELLQQRMEEREPFSGGGECLPGYVGGICPVPKEQCIDAWLADQAVTFLNDLSHKPEALPFFLMVSLDRPHPPNQPPAPYHECYEKDAVELPENLPPASDELDPGVIQRNDFFGYDAMTEAEKRSAMTHYLGNITYVDGCLGKILTALENSGRSGETVIFYFSDHGDMMGDRHTYSKYSLYDSAIRVPLIIKWPGVSKSGHVSQAPVELTDLVPTWLDAANVEPPISLPGRSLRCLLNGAEPERLGWRRGSFAEINTAVYQWTYRENRYKIIVRDGAEDALYDLKNDPTEFYNLAEEPEFSAIETRLRKELMSRIMKIQTTAAKRFHISPKRSKAGAN